MVIRFRAKRWAQATVDRYGREVLDTMINQHLILQACKKNGVEVTNQEVSEEVHRIAKKFNLSLESYLQLLQKERDISPNEYSSEIVWPMLALRRLVANQVQVGEEEFNKAYISQYGEAVKCRMIMVDDRAKAEEIQRLAVANPANFAELAKQKSQDESSMSVGGLIPPIRRYNGDSRLEEAAFALKDKEVSPVLQLGDQWIIFASGTSHCRSQPITKAMPLIKEQLHDRIRDNKMKSAAGSLFEQLQKEANVVHVLGDAELSKKVPWSRCCHQRPTIDHCHSGQKCVKRHGAEVLEGEINRRLLDQSLRKAKKKVTDQDLQAEIVRAAARFGFARKDGTADVDAWMESVTQNDQSTRKTYIEDSVWPSVALSKLVEDKIQLTEEDMRLGFESSYGPRVEILAIVLGDQRTAQKIWEMARDNPTDDFFGKLGKSIQRRTGLV